MCVHSIKLELWSHMSVKLQSIDNSTKLSKFCAFYALYRAVALKLRKAMKPLEAMMILLLQTYYLMW